MKKKLLSLVCLVMFIHLAKAQINVALLIDGVPVSITSPDKLRLCPDSCYNFTLSISGGTSPYTYNWYYGQTTPGITLCTPLTPYIDTLSVLVTDAMGVSGWYFIEGINYNPTHQSICLVTVDSVSGKNMIIWEQSTDTLVSAYSILKETTTAGVYSPLATVPISNLSTYVDASSSPASVSARYKITTLDHCNSESDLYYSAPAHQTMHLTINAGISPAWNLLWNNYDGVSAVKYRIWRNSSSNGMQLIDSVSSSSTSYTDLTPPSGVLSYTIEMLSSANCNPTLKAASSTYSSSFSNFANNSAFIGISEQKLINESHIYPNPFTSEVTFSFNSERKNAFIKIMDLTGKEIRNINFSGKQVIIERGILENGIYFYQLTSDDLTVTTGKLIVQ